MDLRARIETRTLDLERSYIVQRRGMAILALSFPVVFLVSSLLLRWTPFQTSMSAYYWTRDFERDFFVGALCAIGVFLILYKGYTILEDRILDLAGWCAIGVAFVPMNRAGDCAHTGFSPHGAFAIVFFICIAYVCIFMSEKSLRELPDEARREGFRRIYRACAFFMAVSVAVAGLMRVLPEDWYQWLCKGSAIFWCEAIGVWAFGAFWYAKTRELDPDLSWIPFRRRSA